jgi:hypothetical protein
LAPAGLTGRSEAELARSLAVQLLGRRPDNARDALRLLRQAFPNASLTIRVAALDALMRK